MPTNKYQPVKPKCSPNTFAAYASLQTADAAAAELYKKSLKCSLGPTNAMGWVGVWGSDKGKLFPFATTYTDPKQNTTGTCWDTLKKIDADTWNSLPIGGNEMTKASFCNLATVGESPDKTQLASISKQLIATAATIYDKLQNLEKGNRIYFQQHQKYDSKIQQDIATFRQFHNTLTQLQKINSQPDITLGGQQADAILKRRAGYYQFIVWAALAAITLSYTMVHLKR